MKIVCKNIVEPETFLDNYLRQQERVMKFYDYSIDKDGAAARYGEIAQRSYQRDQLVEALERFNEQLTKSDDTFFQINRLRNPESVVVIGGQQAGLLSGPMYTVNKVLSILIEAKKLEEQLQVPVVPIFWIAGEDHDIDEVNHTFFHYQGQVKKIRLAERNDIKQPASERIITSGTAAELVKEGFRLLQETEHTTKLYRSLMEDVSTDCTYVEWFARLLHRLFEGTGLVLMDAADPNIRQLERPYFRKMLQKNDELRQAFVETAREFRLEGYGEPIDIDEKNAHLFFHEQGQRYLLEKKGEMFAEKQRSAERSLSSLLQLLEENKPVLSNNVVTRPVMQDLLFPVISFIAGPGELKYWGTLKGVFHTFGIKMPLVLPRLHLTFISRRAEKHLKWLAVHPDTVAKEGLKERKQAWLEQRGGMEAEAAFRKAAGKMADALAELSSTFHHRGQEAATAHRRYEALVVKGLTQYQQRIERVAEKEKAADIRRFDEVETELRPNGMLQERQLNIVPLLNEYGDDLVRRVARRLEDEETAAGDHLYVYL
ncbi:bacillithiol biosynthesis cysteine-adding enzyme BshC [Evansella caseinilytica]|uniref:Putative cysteine ligase BshC n=1 Tax=Evansella caseinilytica TaxID=1503961 RepID=A0A1H3MI75_9BACI|nr:bacillithiol biosynthesis cysteine-adding enzyme BshC [Evansella caseinilytica]SDY76392.1 bacillithiol biosynthesis cysteine-adding enzyme BshC [Evansella caseinilytica]